MSSLLLFTALMLAATLPALADRYKDCSQLVNLDRTIRGCTRVIKRGESESRNYRAIAYSNRGNAYREKGKHDQAIEDYTNAIKLNPRYANAYYNRGLAYSYKGDNDKEIADYTQAIKLNPRLIDAYNNRGAAYEKKGQYDRAIADYNRALKLDPRRAKVYLNRGVAHAHKGSLDQAIADYTRAIKLNPRYEEAYFSRSLAYLSKGDYKNAVGDASTVIRLKPKAAEAFVLRGDAYHEKGDYLSAASNYRRALSLDLPDERVTQHKWLTAERLGECAALASALARSYADRDQQEVARRFWKMSADFQRTASGTIMIYRGFSQQKTEERVKNLGLSKLKDYWKKRSKRCLQLRS